MKTAIPSLGELLRQLKLYEQHLTGKIFVVSPDARFADKIRQQGFGFIESPGAAPKANRRRHEDRWLFGPRPQGYPQACADTRATYWKLVTYARKVANRGERIMVTEPSMSQSKLFEETACELSAALREAFDAWLHRYGLEPDDAIWIPTDILLGGVFGFVTPMIVETLDLDERGAQSITRQFAQHLDKAIQSSSNGLDRKRTRR